MRIKLSAFLLLTTLLLISVCSFASPMVSKTVEEMTAEASYIVEGTVTELFSAWNDDRSQIYTYVTITVSNSFKGQLSSNELNLRLLGGEIPQEDIGMMIPEAPHFFPDEQVVIFLGQNPQAFFPVVGASQGLFHLQNDTQTGRLMAVPQDGTALTKVELDTRIAQAVQK